MFALYNWLVVVIRIHGNILWDCRSLSYLVNFSLQCSTYLVLAMTVDKYIAIKWPHRAAIHSIPRKARTISCGVIIYVMCYIIPHLFASNFVGNQCVAYVDGGNNNTSFFLVKFYYKRHYSFLHVNLHEFCHCPNREQKSENVQNNTVVNSTGREQGQETRTKDNEECRESTDHHVATGYYVVFNSAHTD